jgi:hypothetical protein
MVARVTPARYGLTADHLRGQKGRLPKKQLAAAHFRSKIPAQHQGLGLEGDFSQGVRGE